MTPARLQPEESCVGLRRSVERHGAMNSAGRVRCNIMPIARGYSPVSQPLFLIWRLTPWDSVGPLCSSYLELEAPARPGLSFAHRRSDLGSASGRYLRPPSTLSTASMIGTLKFFSS